MCPVSFQANLTFFSKYIHANDIEPNNNKKNPNLFFNKRYRENDLHFDLMDTFAYFKFMLLIFVKCSNVVTFPDIYVAFLL